MLQLVSPENWSKKFGLPEILMMKELNQRAPQLLRKTCVQVDVLNDNSEDVLGVLTNCFSGGGGVPELGLGEAETMCTLTAWQRHGNLFQNAQRYEKWANGMSFFLYALGVVTTLLTVIKAREDAKVQEEAAAAEAAAAAAAAAGTTARKLSDVVREAVAKSREQSPYLAHRRLAAAVASKANAGARGLSNAVRAAVLVGGSLGSGYLGGAGAHLASTAGAAGAVGGVRGAPLPPASLVGIDVGGAASMLLDGARADLGNATGENEPQPGRLWAEAGDVSWRRRAAKDEGSGVLDSGSDEGDEGEGGATADEGQGADSAAVDEGESADSADPAGGGADSAATEEGEGDGGAKVFQLTFVAVVAGDLSDFDSEAYKAGLAATLNANVANLGVSAADIYLATAAASVQVSASVLLAPDADAEAARAFLAGRTPEELSADLGLTVEQVVEAIVALVGAPSPPPPSLPPALPEPFDFANGSPLELIMILLPIVATFVTTLRAKVRPREKWGTCLMASHQVVCQIYKYRLRTLEFDVTPSPSSGDDEEEVEEIPPSQRESKARMDFVTSCTEIYSQAISTEVAKSGALQTFGIGKVPSYKNEDERNKALRILHRHVVKDLYHAKHKGGGGGGGGARAVLMGLFRRHRSAAVAMAKDAAKKQAPGAAAMADAAGLSDEDLLEQKASALLGGGNSGGGGSGAATKAPMKGTPVDDYTSPLTIESYVDHRVRPISDYLERRVQVTAAWSQIVEMVGLLASSSGAVLAIVGLASWIVLTVAITAVFSAVADYFYLASQLAATNRALEELHNLLTWWDSLSLVQRKSRAVKAKCVTIVEGAMLSLVQAKTSVSSALPGEKGDDGEEEEES